MYLDRLLLQKEPPKDTSVVWGIPNGDSVTLMIHVDGVWRPINGSGSSSSSSSQGGDGKLSSLEAFNAFQKGLNKTDEELSSMSEREYNAWRDGCVYALKDTTFISDRHGKSVNVLFDDIQNPPKINILYEDGYVVSYRDGYDTEEIPPAMRYCYERDGQYVWLWDKFGEINIGEGNAHTLTTTLYEPNTGSVYNLVYVNPDPESQTYPTYSKWVTHYEYTSDDVVEDRVNYITLARRPQLG